MALSSHLMANNRCQNLLGGEVPPIPPTIHQEMLTQPVVHLPSKRSTRVIVEEPEFNSFPDELSQIATDHPMEDASSPVDCDVCYQEMFQLPSEIIQKAKHLKISLDADDPSIGSDESSEFDVNNIVAHRQEDISARAPWVALPSTPLDKSMHESSPKIGYTLGDVFSIAPNEDFDMLQAFPGSLISMTHIIHFCQMAGVPLYLVDG
jgi:hypothetical protein